MRPLEGIRVIDFSTLLPGPLATLLLAEAGAEVIKIERPGRATRCGAIEPKLGADGVNFALLNRGKRSIAIDLKAPDALARLRPLIDGADVVVEQFRPGVMDRLGLGYDALEALNPRLVYCAITGYGQDGPQGRRRGARPQLSSPTPACSRWPPAATARRSCRRPWSPTSPAAPIRR